MSNNFDVGLRRHLALNDAVAPTPSVIGPLSAAIVSRADSTPHFAAFVRSIHAEPGMLAPDFFLASVSPPGWKPAIVVVSRGPQIVGLVYCKERVVAGIGIRVVFGDDSLGAMVVARPDDIESVIRVSTSALLKHAIALRLLVRADQLPCFRDLEGNAEVSFDKRRHHAHLALPNTYQEFLAKRGPHTRRNFRYYRRRSEFAGTQFVPNINFREFSSACRNLLSKSAHQKSKRSLEAHLAMIEAMPLQIAMGLKDSHGKWIGLAGGWFAGDRAFLVTQLNDRTRTRESVSLVLRAYMIEALISRRCPELVFWEGSSAPITTFANYVDVFMAHFDVLSLRWRLVRRTCAAIRKLAPANFSKFLVWFVRDS
nr:hypothetical protein [Candidatus Acidoferrales bacterium]